MSDYSSVAEVVTLTRHLLDGAKSYTSDTIPTLVEVTKFLDYVAAALNSALANAGFAAPITATRSKLNCDRWASFQAAALCEQTQRGAGFTEEGDARWGFVNLDEEAAKFVELNFQAFIQDGVSMTKKASAGLNFTGLDKSRSDPDNSDLVQPDFTRQLGDHPDGANILSADAESAS